MVTPRHKQGNAYKVGNEISFYYQNEIRTGEITFIGEDSISVIPNKQEVLGVNAAPLKPIEYVIKWENIL